MQTRGLLGIHNMMAVFSMTDDPARGPREKRGIKIGMRDIRTEFYKLFSSLHDYPTHPLRCSSKRKCQMNLKEWLLSFVCFQITLFRLPVYYFSECRVRAYHTQFYSLSVRYYTCQKDIIQYMFAGLNHIFQFLFPLKSSIWDLKMKSIKIKGNGVTYIQTLQQSFFF